jgi:ribosomal-protein-alanine N-acetyltransferase
MIGTVDPALPSVSLRTARLILRNYAASDRTEFARIHQVSADYWRPWLPAALLGESYEQMFDRALEAARRGQSAGTQCRMVATLHDGCMIGIFSLSEIVRGVFQNAYGGWRVSADCAGQGLGTEAVGGLLDLAFAPPPAGLGLHRVQANIIPTNLPSLRVAEKCGLRREGYAPRYLKIAGQWQDHVITAKTAEEHRFVNVAV